MAGDLMEKPAKSNPQGNPIVGVLLVIVFLVVVGIGIVIGAGVWGAVVGFIVDLASIVLVQIARLFGLM
jgi:hypothetical protein